MNILSQFAQNARSPGDPRVVSSGPSSRTATDSVGNLLGWFSLALGAVELAAPHVLTRWLGMRGQEGLVRAYGAREIAAGMASLSIDRQLGLWSRVGGDALDIATLISAYDDRNPRKQNVGIAIAALAGIALLDLISASAVTATHSRSAKHSTRKGTPKDFSERSGWPQGLEAARQHNQRPV